jgi:hypothetical protein
MKKPVKKTTQKPVVKKTSVGFGDTVEKVLEAIGELIS